MTTASAVPDNFIILPSLDLKEGQSLDAALSNLTLLEAQFSKICSQLDQRLSNLKGKLGGINERIGISRQKVETLRDINEAITIVSPSKFVRVYKKGQDATHHSAINTEYVNNKKIPPFNYENNMNLNTNIKPTPTPGPGSSSQGGLLQKTTPGAPPTANGHHHEDELRKVVKLARGMFNTKRELFSGSANIQHQRFEGLGRIPRDVKYVDSLVVFNSRHNPYQKYLQIDNTTSNTNINVPRKKGQKETKINIQEAPRTLVEGEILTQFTTEEHRFKPEAKALPQLVAPTQLGLKGIVNINLGNYEVEGITPSKGGTVNRPTVPDPKFNETTQSNLLDPSMLSVQRFSNVGPNNEAAASPTMQSSYSNPPQNQSQQSSGGYGGFAPTLSQSKQINVQAPTVSVSQPQINMTTSTYVQPQQQRPNNVTQPQNAAPMNPTPQPTNNQAVPANNAAPAQPATNNAAPAAAPKKAGGSRAALLDEIRNPKIKLKKADPDAEEKKAPLERKGGSKPAPAMNHLDHLKQQIQLRFQALNKNKKKEESSEDEEDD